MLPADVQKVYEQIKAEILDDTYPQGTPLPEIHLAEKYGLKRARIRQVISKLEGDSLVLKIPGKGAFVKSITPKEFQSIFEVREALEGMACRLAARRRKDDELEDMFQLFNENQKGFKKDDLLDKIEMGQKLHDFIFKSCENELIAKSIEPLEMQIMKIWQDSRFIPDRINRAYDEHKNLLIALKNRDEDLAESLMRNHITHAYMEYLNTIILK